MKKSLLGMIPAFVIILAVLVAGMTACKDKEESSEPTAVPVPTSSVFNEGKVKYEKKTTTTLIPTFDTALIGKVITSDTKGVETLFAADFNDGDPNCSDNATSRSEDGSGVKDGVLYLAYSEEKDPPLSGGWTTWAPSADASVEDYYQVQLSADMQLYAQGSSPWLTGFIGCFVNNYTSVIPDNSGDGVWLSFNNVSGNITVYGGDADNWKWPQGNVSVKVQDDALKGNTHIDVVCTENYDIYVYVKGVLCCTVKCADDTMKVYNSNDKEVYSGALNMDSLIGTHFSIFAHMGGLGIDNMQVYGCSRGEKKIDTEITAIPTEGNKLGLDITDKKDVVSICYSMWFNVINGEGTNEIKHANNVTELTEKYGFSTEYGFGTKDDQHNSVTAFHYWAKPAQGYYRSTDKEAIKNNMTMLYNAGVDFIILDYTYASAPGYLPGTSTWKQYIYDPSVALLNTIMEMRADGLGTPYVVFWLLDRTLHDTVWDYFYGKEEWKDCFVYWNDKPFVMEWQTAGLETDRYTVRGMYGLRGQVAEGQWSYLEINNSKTVSYDKNGNAEHVCCDVATQETYMSVSTAHGRNGGRFWNEQWKVAFEKHPKIVTVTWWNEWCAQLYKVDGVGYIFTDNFNVEYSRDIEPMEGGHGDLYYRWLCQYISDYRAGKKCPELVQ